MRFHPSSATTLLIFCSVTVYSSAGQQVGNSEALSTGSSSASAAQAPTSALTLDDGLTIIAAALDSSASSARVHSWRDCSHLVHAIYARAGFVYPYARSSDLYSGIENFQRVTDPQPGDLAVWRGHVGIVVSPARHMFFSALRTGPATDTYDAPHWKRKGRVRFYRYLKPRSEKIQEERSFAERE